MATFRFHPPTNASIGPTRSFVTSEEECHIRRSEKRDLGTLPFPASNQCSYQWCPAAMGHSEGTEIHYTVRARTAAGVLSLIPTLGGGASPEYDDVDQGRSLKFIVPGSPPEPVTNLFAEVT